MLRNILTACLSLTLTAAAANAVQPANWTHKTEADFTAGKFDKTVVTSLGEIRLARDIQTLLEPSDSLGAATALAVDAKGQVFLGDSPSGVIYRVDKGKPVKFASIDGAVMIRSMFFSGADLIAAASGKQAGIYRVSPDGKVAKVWSDKDVSMVWAVLAAKDGFFAATGPAGKVYQVGKDGKAEVVYTAPEGEKNILSLAAGRDGILYAGTGENGLIVEIDLAKKHGRVLYNATESEVSCLLYHDGVLYAGTSDTSECTGTACPSDTSGGKPVKLPKSSPSSKPGGDSAAPSAKEPKETKAADDETDKSPSSAEADEPDSSSKSSSSHPTKAGDGESEGGNAVYRIDAEGFVRAIFRRPVSILAMAMQDDRLVLATGHDGQIFAVDPAGQAVTMLAKLDPSDVLALAADGKGGLLAATADEPAVFAIGKNFAQKGTFTSKPLDAKQIARWGTLNLLAEQLPKGCGLTIATRSGNLSKPDDATWSAWSAETPLDKAYPKIASPAGRFLQYRLTLTGAGADTPVLDQVQLIYQVANQAPVIKSVQVTTGGKGSSSGSSSSSHSRGPHSSGSSSVSHSGDSDTAIEPMRTRNVEIDAEDPNSDTLLYAIYYRQIGQQNWVKLADKLSDSSYSWDTLALPDGQYEVRVEASDIKSNPPAAALKAERIFRPVTVDNTPPAITELVAKADKPDKGKVTLSGLAADATSRIHSLSYAVDSNDEWVTMLPIDGICDSPKENFSISISDLKKGTHRISVRALDEYGNAGYASVEVTVEEK